MSQGGVLIPHFKFPLAQTGATFQVTEQDSPADVLDCVTVLLLTPTGSRQMLPSYGSPEVLFTQQPAAMQGILAAINQWEPRATFSLIDYMDAAQQTIDHLMRVG